jgi:hypothetical protein
VAQNPSPIHFIALGATDTPVGMTVVEHPSAEIVRQIQPRAKSMWPRGA